MEYKNISHMVLYVKNVSCVWREVITKLPYVANDRTEDEFMHKISEARLVKLFFHRFEASVLFSVSGKEG